MGKLNKLLAFHQPSKCAKGGRGAGSIPYTDEEALIKMYEYYKYYYDKYEK